MDPTTKEGRAAILAHVALPTDRIVGILRAALSHIEKLEAERDELRAEVERGRSTAASLGRMLDRAEAEIGALQKHVVALSPHLRAPADPMPDKEN